MTWLLLLTALFVVVAFLGWHFSLGFGADLTEALVEKRRATSRMASRGQFIDEKRHVDVALALTDSAFFYENSDMESSIDLEWVRAVEYDDALASGTPVTGKVLRLRCYNQTFEFVVPAAAAGRWQSALAPRTGSAPAVPAIGSQAVNA